MPAATGQHICAVVLTQGLVWCWLDKKHHLAFVGHQAVLCALLGNTQPMAMWHHSQLLCQSAGVAKVSSTTHSLKPAETAAAAAAAFHQHSWTSDTHIQQQQQQQQHHFTIITDSSYRPSSFCIKWLLQWLRWLCCCSLRLHSR